MKKKKITRKKKITYAILLAVVLVIALFVASSPTVINKQEFNTDDGLVKVVITQCGTLCNWMTPVKQTVYFSSTESTSVLYKGLYKIGDTITFVSKTSCEDWVPTTTTKQDAVIKIMVSGPVSKTFTNSKLLNINNHAQLTYTMTMPAATAGEYTVYDSITCYKPGQSTISYSISGTNTRTFSIAQAAIICPSPSKMSQGAWLGNQGYTNVANIFCENWATYSGSSCTASLGYRNCQTTCISNAYCDTSYSQGICDGKQACVKQPVQQEAPLPTPEPTPTPVETPVTPTPTPIPPETTIITPTNQTTPTGTGEQVVVGTTNNYALYIALGVIAIVIIGLVFYFIKMRKGKRK